MTRTRQAFTVVEILVVIGILLVLIGIFFVGMRYVGRSGQENATRTMLQNMRSMVAEFETTTRLNRLYQPYIDDGHNPNEPIEAPGAVYEGGEDRDGEMVHHTHEVMEILLRIPTNRRILEQLPAERLMRDEVDEEHPPILLDGWNNPIIFVPPGGLYNLIVGGVNYTLDNPLRSPDGRPFFASAGPSGNFQNGDDNLYSFED